MLAAGGGVGVGTGIVEILVGTTASIRKLGLSVLSTMRSRAFFGFLSKWI